MTAKTAKTRNPDRRSGKAWSKSHGAPAKVVSPEVQARRKARQEERSQAGQKERGPDITMPRITWEWATEIMASRWPNTRKAVMVERCIVREKGRRDDSDPVIETNPVAKASRTSRKNGR